MSSKEMKSDPLLLGLTRTTLIFGVRQKMVMMNLFITMMIFIYVSELYILGISGVIHLISYIICFHEPLFIELLQVKMQNFNQCSNRSYHGANSYDFY